MKSLKKFWKGLIHQCRGELFASLWLSGKRGKFTEESRGPCRSVCSTYSFPGPLGPGSPDSRIWALGYGSIEAIGIICCVISAPCYGKPRISLIGNNCLRVGSNCFIYSEERRYIHPAITVPQQTLVELAPGRTFTIILASDAGDSRQAPQAACAPL